MNIPQILPPRSYWIMIREIWKLLGIIPIWQKKTIVHLDPDPGDPKSVTAAHKNEVWPGAGSVGPN